MTTPPPFLPLALWTIAALAWPPLAGAAIHAATPGDYVAVVASAGPGDTVRLAPGLYSRGLRLHGLMGSPGAPFVIEGPAAGEPAVFIAAPGRNTVSLLDSVHVVVRNLVLDGRGLPVDGVKCEGHARFAHHITLEGLTIRGHGRNQQTVGISSKCPAWNWVIRDNVIEGAGTGIYLGNSDGSDPFVAGLIEGNRIVDSVGYALQIKHQAPRPQVAGMPTAVSETHIRRNVFSKANGGSQGDMARPNVLLGHFPLDGAGVDDQYRVYGNFFHDNPHESLLQAEGNVSIHDNIF